MKLIWLVFLCIAAGMDVWEQKIPVWLYQIFGAAGTMGVIMILQQMEPGWSLVKIVTGVVLSMGTGVMMLFLSIGTRGAVGSGDGLFFLVSGLYLSWQENLSMLFCGLLLSSIYGVGLILWGKRKGISMRKKSFPFLPFLLPIGMWVVNR